VKELGDRELAGRQAGDASIAKRGLLACLME